MNCTNATKVYASDKPLEAIKEVFPDAWSFLEDQAQGYVDHTPDSFDTQVKEIVGDTDFTYRAVHSDDKSKVMQDVQELLGDVTSRLMIDEYFSNKHETAIYFNTFCCSSCAPCSKVLTIQEAMKLQKAAISLQ